jgi:hypothetical protein
MRDLVDDAGHQLKSQEQFATEDVSLPPQRIQLTRKTMV